MRGTPESIKFNPKAMNVGCLWSHSGPPYLDCCRYPERVCTGVEGNVLFGVDVSSLVTDQTLVLDWDDPVSLKEKTLRLRSLGLHRVTGRTLCTDTRRRGLYGSRRDGVRTDLEHRSRRNLRYSKRSETGLSTGKSETMKVSWN